MSDIEVEECIMELCRRAKHELKWRFTIGMNEVDNCGCALEACAVMMGIKHEDGLPDWGKAGELLGVQFPGSFGGQFDLAIDGYYDHHENEAEISLGSRVALRLKSEGLA